MSWMRMRGANHATVYSGYARLAYAHLEDDLATLEGLKADDEIVELGKHCLAHGWAINVGGNATSFMFYPPNKSLAPITVPVRWRSGSSSRNIVAALRRAGMPELPNTQHKAKEQPMTTASRAATGKIVTLKEAEELGHSYAVTTLNELPEILQKLEDGKTSVLVDGLQAMSALSYLLQKNAAEHAAAPMTIDERLELEALRQRQNEANPRISQLTDDLKTATQMAEQLEREKNDLQLELTGARNMNDSLRQELLTLKSWKSQLLASLKE